MSMIDIGTVRHSGMDLRVMYGRYHSHRTSSAVHLMEPSGAPYAKASVYIAEADLSDSLFKGEFVAHKHVDQQLMSDMLESGLFRDTGRRVSYGRATDVPVLILRHWQEHTVEYLKQMNDRS